MNSVEKVVVPLRAEWRIRHIDNYATMYFYTYEMATDMWSLFYHISTGKIKDRAYDAFRVKDWMFEKRSPGNPNQWYPVTGQRSDFPQFYK